MIRSDGELRNVSIRISLAPEEISGEGKYIIELLDIYNVHSHLYDMELKAAKYKNILDGMSEMFFEYDSRTEVFTIFKLAFSCEEAVYRVKLEDVLNSEEFPCAEEDITKFKLFCHALEKGEPFVDFTFTKAPFIPNASDEPVIFRGRSISMSEHRTLTVGCIGKPGVYSGSVGTDSDSIDMMTGLLNKNAILDIAKTSVTDKKYNQVFFIMIDLDNFKLVNDSYGHMFGDEVIKTVAMILKSNVKQHGFVGRFGGDEYFAVLHSLGSEGDLRAIVGSIKADIRNAFKDRLEGFNITPSIGISEYPRNGSSFDILFKKADKAVYIAKSKGRNRFIIYKEEMHGEIDLNDTDGDYRQKLDMRKFMGDTNHYKIMRDGITSIMQNGTAALDSFMNSIINGYTLTGISLYAGKDFTLKSQWGKYTNPMENADYMLSKRAVARFNEKNIFKENNVRFNNFYVPCLHNKLIDHGIEATVQCMIKNGDKLLGIMTFDVGNAMRKWNEEDINYFGIISQLVGNMLIVAK
jgi:diguanylate cyclase (GGDEF)-like protein